MKRIRGFVGPSRSAITPHGVAATNFHGKRGSGWVGNLAAGIDRLSLGFVIFPLTR
jgi:hypothetical protein